MVKSLSLVMSLILISPCYSGQIANSILNTDKHVLLGHWHFDEQSGVTAKDSSGNGNNGTLTNGATFVSGINGMAVSGGTSGGNQYVNFGSPASGLFNVDVSTPFLVGIAYTRPKTVNPSGADVIIGKVNWTGNFGWHIKTAQRNNTWKWEITTRGNSGDVVNGDARTFEAFAVTNTFTNSLQTLFVYYDGANTNRSWNVCQNGVCSNSITCNAGDCVTQGSLTTTQDLRIGGAAVGTVEWKGGTYDEFIFSSGTWTTGEIQRLDNILKSRHHINDEE